MKIRLLIRIIILNLLVRACIQQEEAQACVQQEKSFKCSVRPLERFKSDVSIPNEPSLAYPGQWPWYGTVWYRQAGRSMEYACGGTLISRKHVLTSTVCLRDDSGSLMESSKIMVQLGTHNHNVLNLGFAQYRKVKLIHQPQDADADGHNEILILELNVDVKFSDYVHPICLVDKSFEINIRILLGWEFKNEEGQVNRLSSHQECAPFNDHALIRMCYVNKIWFLDSIDSCNQNHPINDRIMFDFRDWITDITNLDYLKKIRKGQYHNESQKYPQLLPRLHCGKGHTGGENNARNGSLYEFPRMVQLFSWIDYFNRSMPTCTGTLISHRYVISIIACVGYKYPEFVRLGEYNSDANPDCDPEDTSDCAPPVKDYAVEYTVYQADLAFYSIALIRTNETVAYADHIQPACLPVTAELKKLIPSQYTIVTWDSSKPNDTLTGVLKKQIVHFKQCELYLGMGTYLCLVTHRNLGGLSFGVPSGVFGRHLFGAPIGAYVGKRFVVYAIGSPLRRLAVDIFHYIDWLRANMLD